MLAIAQGFGQAPQGIEGTGSAAARASSAALPKALAWDPLAFPLAISSGYALCRDADTARSFWRAQPDSALDCAHDVHRTQVRSGPEGSFAQVAFAAPVPASQLLLLDVARVLGLTLRAAEEDRDWQHSLVAAARSRT